MFSIIKKLRQLTRAAPKEVKWITWYNIINFIFSLIINLVFGVLFIVIFSSDKIRFQPDLILTILLPIIFVLFSYYVLIVTKQFLVGSMKAYWILLILFALQCFSFNINDLGLEFQLAGIPLSFSYKYGDNYIAINFAAILITIFLLSFKRKYLEYLEIQGGVNVMNLENAEKGIFTILPEEIQCPHCSIELELEKEERTNRKFNCPNCNEFIDLSTG